MVTNQRQKIDPNTKKDKKALSIGDVIIPALGILIFLLVCIFVYFPMITEGNTLNQEITDTKSKQIQVNNFIISVKQLDRAVLNSDFTTFSKVIPKRLEVADFAAYIDQLAVQKNLTLQKISASNSKGTTTNSAGTTIDDSVFSVSGPLSYSGRYSDIVNFMNDLQEVSPYIISISNIKIDEGTADEWSLQFTVTGYYIDDTNSATNANIFNSIISYSSNQDVVKILRTRASKM